MDKITQLHMQKRCFVDIILENKECYIFDTAAEIMIRPIIAGVLLSCGGQKGTMPAVLL